MPLKVDQVRYVRMGTNLQLDVDLAVSLRPSDIELSVATTQLDDVWADDQTVDQENQATVGMRTARS